MESKTHKNANLGRNRAINQVIAMVALILIGTVAGCSEKPATTETNLKSNQAQESNARAKRANKNTKSVPTNQQSEKTKARVEPEVAAPEPVPSQSKESEAKAYSKKVKAELDITTSEQLLSQMPNNIQPAMDRDAENRSFTWTFGDGSQLVAVFRPAGEEGGGQGLVLYMVDIKD